MIKRLISLALVGFLTVACSGLDDKSKFSATLPSVQIWDVTNKDGTKPPVMIYAHGGAGYRGSDEGRVFMFQEQGFATVVFDAYEMNGLSWRTANYVLSNEQKQVYILNALKGAYEYALTRTDWDTRNIFVYGQSNGGMAVINLPDYVKDPSHIRGFIVEGMSADGIGKPDIKIPTRAYYGDQDTWGGGGDMWSRTNYSTTSVKDWVAERKKDGVDVEMLLYKNAGHSFHYGSMSERHENRGPYYSFTAYLGAGDGVVEQYNKDVFRFVNSQMIK